MSFLHKFHRLKKLPPHQIPFVIASKARRYAATALERSRHGEGRRKNKGDAKLHPTELFHADIFKPGFSESFLRSFPQDAARIIAAANDALELKVDLLGSGLVDLKKFRERTDLRMIVPGKKGELQPARVNGRIPWHFDFKSGIGWEPKAFYADLNDDSFGGSDIKVPWELSRCAHFVTMGQAYKLTHDEKYAIGFVSQLSDWLDHNPPQQGVNWVTPMDIALRAVSWIGAWEMFRDSSSVTDKFRESLANALDEHGEHIYNHLEWGGGVSTNHYLSNLLGLLFIGTALRNSKWTRFAQKELAHEMKLQVRSDGFDYEASTSYQKLVLEIFFYAHLLKMKTRGDEDPTGITLFPSSRADAANVERLKKMFEALILPLNENGENPQIGDNDSGFVFSLAAEGPSSFTAMASIGQVFFRDPFLARKAWPANSDLVWIMGFSGHAYRKSLQGGSTDDVLPQSSGGPSGLLTLRGPDDTMVFVAQPNGTKGVGNHTHNDKLSFVLSVKGEWFFVDPGSGLYMSDAFVRNQFRSTAIHNTIEVDHEEQNRWVKTSLFTIENDARVKILAYKANVAAAANHSGYARLPGKVMHERRVTRGSANAWRIEDKLTGAGTHRLMWNFTLGESIAVEKKSDRKVRLIGKTGEINFEMEGATGEFMIEEGRLSPAYGVMRPTSRLRVYLTAALPLNIVFRMEWKHVE